jgi:hypothetical protein
MGNLNLSQLCGPNYEGNQDIVSPEKKQSIQTSRESDLSVKVVRAFKPRYNESEWERLRTAIVVRNYFRHWKLDPLLNIVSSIIN